jgi:hypothetical protein
MAALRTNTFKFALQEVCADMIRYLEDQGCPRPLIVRNISLTILILRFMSLSIRLMKMF